MLLYPLLSVGLIIGGLLIVLAWRRRGVRAAPARSDEGRPDVYLSCNHRDRPAAQRIADALHERGVSLLEDKAVLASEGFNDTISGQLDASDAMLVVLGPERLSEWQHRELDYMLERRRRGDDVAMVALLLPGADLPPAVLRSVQVVDLRGGVDAAALDLLAGTLRRAPAAPQRPAAVEDVSPSPRGDDVRFTVYRPAAVPPARWCEMLVFAHRTELPPDAPPGTPSPAERVREEAERLLGARARGYDRLSEDSAVPVARATQLVFVPEIDGVQFNPPRASIDWLDDVHSVLFRLRADDALEGLTARGRLTIYGGPLLLAEMALVIRVSASAAEAAARADAQGSVAPYRRVFASYSHRDERIVRQVEAYARAFGDDYLRDVTALRAGERWDARIARLIEDADVFQLFWSWNALESEYVRREWNHALALGRPHFVRPVYWEEPLPEAPDRDLPPDALRVLHFQRLPFEASAAQPAAPGSRSPSAPPSAPSAPRRPRGLFAAPLGAAAMVMLAIAGVTIVNRVAEPPEQAAPVGEPTPDPGAPTTAPPPPTGSEPVPLADGVAVSPLVAPADNAELRAFARRLSETLAGAAPVVAPVVDSITLEAALSAARRQGARTLLTGTVAPANGDLLVHVRLVDATTSATVVEQRYRTAATADIGALAARIRTDVGRVR